MSAATQNCEFCGSPAHVWFNCPKKPDGWKPDRLKKPVPTLAEIKGATAALERAFPSGATSAATPESIRPAQKPRGPEKSTAARKDVPGSPPVIENRSVPGENGSGYPVNGEAKVLAASSEVPGTQLVQVPPGSGLENTTVAILDGTLTARGTPRKRAPKGTFDRKAWQRDKAKERRARLRAAKEEKTNG